MFATNRARQSFDRGTVASTPPHPRFRDRYSLDDLAAREMLVVAAADER